MFLALILLFSGCDSEQLFNPTQSPISMETPMPTNKTTIQPPMPSLTSLNYLETTYALLIQEYTADVLITSNDNSIVLFSNFKGTPSCDEIGSKPIVGIITKMEEVAKVGMYKTNLMGIRNYPDALILRFCGGCTKKSKILNNYLYFGFSAFSFLGFLFSLYLQEKKWSAAEKAESHP